jgi:CRISPR/Cas system-associated endonuclease Cas1
VFVFCNLKNTNPEELQPLIARYEVEKGRANTLRDMQRKLQELQGKVEVAKRRNDLALVADLQYGAIPDLMKRIKETEAAEKRKSLDKSSKKKNFLLSFLNID